MHPVTTSVKVKNEELTGFGRAGQVIGNEKTHPVLSQADRDKFAENEDDAPWEVDPGNILVLLDGDKEPIEFALSDVEVLRA